jgi:hypothetical protein
MAHGEVSERLIEPVSKTGVLFIEYRGFESRPLRWPLANRAVLRQAQDGEPVEPLNSGTLLRFGKLRRASR